MQKGQIFTPKDIAKYMISLINKDSKNILEPSFGQGVFLDLLHNDNKDRNYFGIELDTLLYSKLIEKYNNNNIKTNNFINKSFLQNDKYYFENIDTIIGNPPYVQNNEINKETIKELENLGINIDNKEWDLYYYFIYQAIKQLKNKGQLIFIVPITFLTNTYAKSLRDFMYDNGYFSKIISMEESKIFNDKSTKTADVEVIIFEYIKDKKLINKTDKEIDIQIIKDKYKGNINNNVFDNYPIKHFSKNDFFWNIYKRNNNINNIYKKPILDVFNISVGMVSGYDKAFIVDNIKKFNTNELQYIKSFYKAKNCGLEHTELNYMIFIDRNIIKNENELKSKLPNIYNHLQGYKDNLINRYKGDKTNYWEFSTIRNKDIYSNNNIKFFIPNITRKNEIGFTEKQGNDIYGSGDVVCLTFKNNITEEEQYKYRNILLSKKYAKYLEESVIRKGNRRTYTQKFLTTLNI